MKTHREFLETIIGTSLGNNKNNSEAELASILAEVIENKFYIHLKREEPEDPGPGPVTHYDEQQATVETTLKSIFNEARIAFMTEDLGGSLTLEVNLSGPMDKLGSCKVEYTGSREWNESVKGHSIGVIFGELIRRATFNRANEAKLMTG